MGDSASERPSYLGGIQLDTNDQRPKSHKLETLNPKPTTMSEEDSGCVILASAAEPAIA